MTDARDPAEAPDSAEGVQADRPDALAVATDELLPLTRMLVELAKEEGQADQLAFFEIIHRGIENARDPDDLAGPFMELSTSAFRGFAFSPARDLPARSGAGDCAAALAHAVGAGRGAALSEAITPRR